MMDFVIIVRVFGTISVNCSFFERCVATHRHIVEVYRARGAISAGDSHTCALRAGGAARERYGDHLWVKCHKDFSPTTCPGTTLTEWVAAGMSTGQPHTNRIVDWGAILRYITEAGLAYVIDRPIKRGSTGKWVSIAQQKLNDRINAGLKVDGIYGKKSVPECKRFQSQFAMKVNGIVDERTWKVLWT